MQEQSSEEQHIICVEGFEFLSAGCFKRFIIVTCRIDAHKQQWRVISEGMA
jgi:hypothetical protein